MSLLNIADNLTIQLPDVLGQCIAILGIRGSGKSNTATVLAEEMLAAGLPVCIVDIAGEFFGLKEKYQVLVAGKSAHVDVPLATGQGAALAEFSFNQRIPVILDLSGYRRDDRFDVLSEFLEQAWELAGNLRTPYFVFLEEAHNYIPQSGGSPVDDIVTAMVTEGRKRGLSLVMISQRPQKINKDVLTQAELYFLHRVRHPLDIKAYQDIIADKAVKDGEIRQLETGQAMVLQGEQRSVVCVRKQHTFHAGYTPGLESMPTPELRPIDSAMLDKLRDILTAEPVPGNPEEGAQLRKQIEQLKAQIEMLTQDNAQLQEQIGLMHNLYSQSEPPHDTSSSPASVGEEEHRTPLATKRAINYQQRRFQTLLSDIRGQKPHHLRILKYLTKREDTRLSTIELARYLGYSLSTLVNAPPTWMIKEGLLHRQGDSTKTYQYWSNIRQSLTERFPDLNTEELIEQIERVV